MTSPIVFDAEGPWLPDEPGPLDPARKAELRLRLTTTKLPDDVLTKYQLRGPIVSRAVRMGVLEWVEEKAQGDGTDWPRGTMAKYRAILREVGPPDGGAHRQAGWATVTPIGAAGGLAAAGAGAATGSPAMALAGVVVVAISAAAQLDITGVATLLRYVESGSVVVVMVLDEPAVVAHDGYELLAA